MDLAKDNTMDEPILDRALRRKRELHGELAEIEAFLAVYSRLANEDSQAGKTATPPNIEQMQSAVHLRSSPSSVVLKAAEEVLLGRKNEAITPSRLVTELNYRGVVVGGSRPGSNISAMLSNSPRFRSMGRKVGWILTDYKEQEFQQPSEEATR
jgi:hypothetical protein